MSQLGYANHKILRGMFKKPWHDQLTEVLIWLTIRYSSITLTSTFRSKKIHSQDSGIHSTNPLRAFDIRSRDFLFPQRIAKDINDYWIYDPNRDWLNVCVYHNTGHGWHFHLQVHDNTEVKKELTP